VTGALVGLLVIVWFTPPSPSVEYLATLSLHTVASQIVNW